MRDLDPRETAAASGEETKHRLGRPDFWRDVFAQLPDGAAIARLDGTLVEVNEAFCRMTGFDRSEVVGTHPPYPHWAPESVEQISRAIAAAISGITGDYRATLKKKTGERFPVSIHSGRLIDADGRPQAIFATLKDMSEYDRLERELRASEARWKSVAESSYDYMALMDRNYRFQYVNRVAPLPSGVDPKTVLAMGSPFDFVEPERRAFLREVFERAFRDGVPSQFEQYVPALGQWLFCRVGPIREGGEVTAVSLIANDITEKKRAEEALRTNEQRLQLALAAGAMGAFDWDLNSGVFTLTPRLYEILGYEPGDPAVGTALEGFFERVHPDDLARVQAAVVQELEAKAPFDAQYRLRRADGEYTWVHCRARTTVDANGNAHTSGVVTDISARVHSEEERERLEAQVRQAQKMETLGTLAGGIAHDFNNLLTPVLGNAEVLLMTDGATTESARERLEDILSAANRAKDLVRRILVFARRGDQERRHTVRLQEVVAEVIRLVTPSVPNNVEVVTDVDERTPPVWGLSGEMHQAVTNLCVNAQQALRGKGGHIKVGVHSVKLDEAFAAAHGISSGMAVRVSVEDDGPGFPAEIRERLFEPFFTTKPVGEGVGLGLAMVHAIMKRHGGAAVAETVPSGGARFVLYFPCDSAVRAETRLRKASSLPTTTARILCVDDEPTVLRILGILLRQGGFDVTLVSSPNEALARLRAKPDAYDLLVTDQTMPGMSGLDLARKVHDIRSALPVLLVTGYGESGDDAGLPSDVRVVVRKPFTLDTLISAVKTSLMS